MFIYDHHAKLELANKIRKIQKKRVQYNIFEMIGDNTKNCNHNENGTFIFFHDLPNETYVKLNNYVNSVYATKMKKELTNIVTETDGLENKELDNMIADINTEKLNQGLKRGAKKQTVASATC